MGLLLKGRVFSGSGCDYFYCKEQATHPSYAHLFLPLKWSWHCVEEDDALWGNKAGLSGV